MRSLNVRDFTRCDGLYHGTIPGPLVVCVGIDKFDASKKFLADTYMPHMSLKPFPLAIGNILPEEPWEYPYPCPH